MLISDFAETLQRVPDVEAATDVLRAAAESVGAEQFAYFHIGGGGYQFQTSYDPAWATRYEEQQYVDIDPVALTGRASVLPFRWNDLRRRYGRNKRHAKVFREGDDFGLRHGLSFPVHGPGGSFALASLVSRHSDITDFGLDHQMELQALTLFYHAALERLKPGPRPVSLTPREKEVLLWALRGKSAWDTSEICGISEHTVVFHIENAKRKLAVRSKIEAVTKAVMIGAITP
jgi:DNA-binding CsgD family transcriptional regulator